MSQQDWATNSKLVGTQIITVVVENGNFHNGGTSKTNVLTLLAGNQGQFDKELLVGLPLVVVNNLDTNLLFTFFGLKSQNFIERLIVFLLLSRTIDSFNPEDKFNFSLVLLLQKLPCHNASFGSTFIHKVLFLLTVILCGTMLGLPDFDSVVHPSVSDKREGISTNTL